MNEECQDLQQLYQSPEILSLIATWEGSELALQTRLRQEFPDQIVRTALLIDGLRSKAKSKFSRAASMWFDRRGLEQATAEIVARHKAKRFQDRVWDLCSGVGGDAIALAEHCDVTAVDLNPASCLRLTWNSRVYGVEERITARCEDVMGLTGIEDLIHLDPDRRVGSEGRASRIEHYVPGLKFLQDLARGKGGAIKVGPASNFGGKFPGAEIELISLSGECKEATVWFGELAGTQPFRATILPSGETIAGHPLDVAAPIAPLSKYLYDPDPAVVRAGLLDLVADQLGLGRLDSAEEYLTGDQLVESPFVQPFEILAELPNNENELRAWLRTSDFGQVEIKCRHLRVHAESLRRRLTLPGDKPGVVVYVRINGRARIVLGRRISTSSVFLPR